MVTRSGQPAYRQIVDDLTGQMRRGDLMPGDPLPSIARLCDHFGVSASVVKSAITVLRTRGLVIGQQGKGVFVHGSPPSTDADRDVTIQLDELRRDLREMKDRLAVLESVVLRRADEV